MSDVNQFRAMRPVTSIFGTTGSAIGDFYTTSGLTANHISQAGARSTLSGSTSAGVLKTLLSVTGSGNLRLALMRVVPATSQTYRFKINIDGVTVFDLTTAAGNFTNKMIPGVGTFMYDSLTSGIIFTAYEDVVFNQSMSIEVATGNAATDAINLIHRYFTF